MKKGTNDRNGLKAGFLLGILVVLFSVLSIQQSFAVAKTSTGGNWNTAATWSPSGVPLAGDDVTILSGTVNVDVNAVSNNITINSGATLNFNNNSLTVGGNWLNNGTFNHGCQCLSNTVIMTGNGATMGGSSVSLFNNLTINTPGATNIVSLTNSNIKIDNSGTLTLQNGILKIGAANALTMSNGQSTTITVVNGNFANAADGTGLHTNADGGTINAASQSGANITVNGNAVFNNITSSADANWHLQLNSTGVKINGTLKAVGANSWGFATTGNAPIWGPASTYYLDRANQGLAWPNSDLSWVSMASGTIGVTPGYPNNIILTNLGSSQTGDGTGLGLTGNVAINGTLTVGDGITNGRISMATITSFTSGGIVVNNNSLIIGPPTAATFINKGNFTLAGATTGIFQSSGATINFAGAGTKASPQVISTTGSSVSFTNMTISNGTYVQLQDPVSITSTLNLSSGYIGTSATNSLSINNTATTAIVGGSATAYIDGPLTWSIPATTSGNYVYPVGDKTNNVFLPLTLSPNTTSGANTTVTAFGVNSNGVPDGTINTISTTEYWSVTTSSPFTSGPLVSVSRPSAVAPNNALGVSSASNGIYTAIGGTPSGSTMSGGGIGIGTPAYIVLVNAPLSVVKLSGTNVTCNGTTGSLTVGGSGGTAPYTYSVDGGAFQVSGTFSPLSVGNHNVTVRDATMATATTVLKVLGSILINGDDKDVHLCPPASTTLVASNLLNATPTYSWNTGASTASITVAPTVPTTYTVTSQLYNNNLFTNGSFESGASGFTSSYTNYVGAQYATTPGNNGYYSVSNAGINQCQYFSTTGIANQPSLSAQNGALYFIGDGATASSMVWSQTVTGLTVGVVYRFQFYYAAGDPDLTRAVLRPTINGGGSLGDITTTNSNAWTLATYNWTATATSAVVALTNMTATGSTNGNDFFLDNMQFLAPCTVSTSINVVIDCSLPVEFSYFNVKKQGAGAMLSWGTATETNCSHFVVEKSTDGVSFTEIGMVKASGTSFSTTNYSFVDPTIVVGTTYYKIAQYDFDGTVHYSEIKVVTKEGTTGVQVYPNPNNGQFVLTLDKAVDAATRVSIVNALGQLVYMGAESTSNVMNVDISQLASGLYYLQVNTNEETIIKKIVKE